MFSYSLEKTEQFDRKQIDETCLKIYKNRGSIAWVCKPESCNHKSKK